tara:strand:+ start:567 stop:764 length:198 start_codon:yes stop_codon:yes gene_type:complete
MEQIQENSRNIYDDLGSQEQYSLKEQIINPNKNNNFNDWNKRLNKRLKKFGNNQVSNKDISLVIK